MNAVEKVAQYLNINEEYLTVDEWASVYWVKVKGKRPTLLSKKLVNRSAQIRIGYTVGGDALAKDDLTGRCFIMRQPGYECPTWAIKEIAEHQISKSLDFSDVRKPLSQFTVFASDKPQTVRELMVSKAIRYSWSR